MTRTTMTTTRSHALARPAPLAAIMPWVQVTWPRLVIWWNAQTSRTKLALAVAAQVGVGRDQSEGGDQGPGAG